MPDTPWYARSMTRSTTGTPRATKNTPLTPEQSELATAYFGFSQAEAVTIWHKSLHSGPSAALYVGDDEDARDIGTQALLRSCQAYPLPCNVCKGTGKHTSAVTGSNVCCRRCNGSGEPKNQHKAFHAYLRLAIRTQVINEINKRTWDKMNAAKDARRSGSSADGEETAGDEGGLGVARVRIYGARVVGETSMAIVGLAAARGAELNIHQSLKLPIVDVSATSAEFAWLAPSNTLRLSYPQRAMLTGKVSVEGFRRAYRGYLRSLLRKTHFADRWRDLLAAVEDGAVLVSGCDARCAYRSVLGEVLAAAVEGEFLGEVSAKL